MKTTGDPDIKKYRIDSQYVVMELRIEKFAKLIMKKGKRETTEGRVLRYEIINMHRCYISQSTKRLHCFQYEKLIV